MKEYKNKFVWRSFVYSPFVIFLFIIFIILLSTKIFSIYEKYSFTKSELEDLSASKEKLLSKKYLSEERLKDITTPEGIEKYIREVYPVKKNGEDVVIVYDTAPATYSLSKEKTYLQKLKEWYNNLMQ